MQRGGGNNAGGRGRGNSNGRGGFNNFNGRGGFRGRGRGRGSYNNNVGNQGNQTTSTQNQNQTTSKVSANQPTSQNNQRRRGPFCFHCEKNGADLNHWPFQCTWQNQILSDWHADQNAIGHQKQSQNLNG